MRAFIVETKMTSGRGLTLISGSSLGEYSRIESIDAAMCWMEGFRNRREKKDRT